MVKEVVRQSVPAGVSPIQYLSRSSAACQREPHRFYDASKRSADLLVSAALLVLTLPLVTVACLVILLTTRQAPLLLQRRVGWQGKQFTMLKLRTMDCEDEPPAFLLLSKPSCDERVTPVGRFLRRTSIDELPQLINVLFGQMTLVGPRPVLPSEVIASPRPGYTGSRYVPD